jgi:tetratricopeptide (TPR) repeat protein/predicted aspartyl protease
MIGWRKVGGRIAHARLRLVGLALLLVAAMSPAPAQAKCDVARYFELPVTMVGRKPVVTLQINGREARFILDSGAFFSTIAKANALEYGLTINAMPGARLKGIGGDTSLGYTVVKDMRIAGNALHNVEFAVGGSDTGFAGLLGQNILGLTDIEYDLPHGMVRLFKTTDCKNVGLAYWAGSKPVTILPVEPIDGDQRHVIAPVTIDGKKMNAVFDTGAGSSLLTLAAARRLGTKPGDPDVVQVGASYGLGQRQTPTWRARFDTIDIGGELIRKPMMAFTDFPLQGADMLIGVDFFLTHRIFIDNHTHRMFVTYEGGPLFGLDPKTVVDDSGKALDLTDKAGEPTDAAGYSRRGAIAMSHGQPAEALADLNKAVAMAPKDARYRYQRATLHLGDGQQLLAREDIDQAIILAPEDARARLLRAQMRVGANDPNGAIEDLKVADSALAESSDERLALASLYDAVEAPEAALTNYDAWLKAHPEDHDRATAFNGRCWARAQMGRDLDKALSDCEAALKLRPRTAAFLDSRALVRLRRNELDKAQADYDAALAINPLSAWSLYARSITERRAGQTQKADVDKAAALAINPRVEQRAKRIGLINGA